MKKILTMISAGLLFITTSCTKTQDVQPANDTSLSPQERSAISDNGTKPILLDKTVYYNTQLFNVKLMSYLTLGDGVRPVVNTMYVITESATPGTAARFFPVLNKLPSGNFSNREVWQVVNIIFGPTMPPFQVRSEAEITRLLSVGAVVAEKTDLFYQMMITYSIDPSGDSK
jgi:hypothetical protein